MNYSSQKAIQAIVIANATRDPQQQSQRLALFDETGAPIAIGGGSTMVPYNGTAELPVVPNDGDEVVLPFIEFPDGLAGTYLGKVTTGWGGGGGMPTTGFASVQLLHIDVDDNELTIVRFEMNTDHNTTGEGDAQLGPGNYGVKMDFAIAYQDGIFEARARQITDQEELSVSVTVDLVKL